MLEMLTGDEVGELREEYPKGTRFLAITRRDHAVLSRAFDKLYSPDEWTPAQEDMMRLLDSELKG